MFNQIVFLPSRMRPLGTPIPNTEHAISVSIPTWQDVIDYEEGKAKVHERLRTGYPRFVLHFRVKQLMEYCRDRFFTESYDCLIFPSRVIANRCKQFIEKMAMNSVTEPGICIHEIPVNQSNVFFVVGYPKIYASLGKAFWQHSGDGIGSRAAKFVIEYLTLGDTSRILCDDIIGLKAKDDISNMLSQIYFGSREFQKNILLFPSGMSSINFTHQLVQGLFCGSKCVQFGFPYLDTLKVFEKFGNGSYFFGMGDAGDLILLTDLLQSSDGRSISAVFCEFPSNPLLKCCDLVALKKLSDIYGFVIVIDDTLAFIDNLDLIPFADVIVTSLSKIFSGNADVMAGSVTFNPKGRHYQKLYQQALNIYEDTLWTEDAVVLEKNSRDVISRIATINYNTEKLCDILSSHPLDSELYRKFRKHRKDDSGSYGGVFSILIDGSEDLIQRFFDALDVCKGPSLGTNFTLACPYTLLAHYRELEWAEKFRVSRNLIRISVGLEDVGSLVETFDQALRQALVQP